MNDKRLSKNDRIKRILSEIKERSGRYDFSDPDTSDILKKNIDKVFSESFVPYESNEAPFEYGEDNLIRRKAAVSHLLREANDKFSEKYPELNIADEMIRLSAPIHTLTFDRLNRVYDFELAAAIWILDYLKANELYDQAIECFPQHREEIDSVYLPILSDSVHSDDELRSMIYVIRNKDRGEQSADEDHPDRKNFDAILSLIEKSDIRFAQETFISLIWDFFDCVLSLISSRQQGIIQLTKGKGEDISEIDLTEEQLEEIQRNLNEIESVYQNILLVSEYQSGELSYDSGMDQIFLNIKIPQLKSPYEMCFAFVSLLNADSDYVWIYNLCYDVLESVCRLLPWAGSNVVDPDDSLDELSVDYAYMQSLVEKMPDWSDDRTNEIFYHKSIPSPFVSAKRDLISPSQLVFLSSGLIPPRQGRSISYTKLLLNESKLSKDQQDLLYEYVSLAYSINHKDLDFSDSDEDEVSSEISKDHQEIRDREKEIKKLRTEIKHLKNIVNQTEHKYKEISVRLREANMKLDVSATELSELRSMIRESIDKDEESPISVSFPYAVNKRTVIIGGHQSWMNAMKTLIKDARFIAASQQPNTGVILNSEVVWIQTNALGHSGFYKIIDIIRRNNIPVCYFKYSSAEKCAEQIALYDSADEGEETPSTE